MCCKKRDQSLWVEHNGCAFNLTTSVYPWRIGHGITRSIQDSFPDKNSGLKLA